MIGETVKHFRIEAQAGEGGMGIVYRATDTRLHRPVALKFLRRELIESAEARDRFTREARAAARLTHPNIAAIYDIMEHEGQSVIVMEWVDGGSLSGRKYRTPREWEEALDILGQIASGLDAAHAAGVIHRDIKPSNILLTSSGTVKITDFGVARLRDATTTTQTGGRIVGTPSRMAPEQWAGEKIDHRVDIFALGTIAYELLTGQPPFSGETFEALGYQILSAPHAAPSTRNPVIPAGVDAATGKCLAKSPDDRPDTCAAFVGELRKATTGDTTQPEVSRDPRSRVRRNLPKIVVGAILAAVAAWALFWPRDSANINLAAEAMAAVQKSNPEKVPVLLVMRTVAGTNDDQTQFSAAGLSQSLHRTFRDRSGLSVIDFDQTPKAQPKPDWRDLRARTQADFAIVSTLASDGPGYTCSAALVALESEQTVWQQGYENVASSQIVLLPTRILDDVTAEFGWNPGQGPAAAQPALMFSPAVQAWLNRGDYYMETGDYALAEAMYDSALATSPGQMVLHYWIGKAMAAQNRHEEAIYHYKLALPDAPHRSTLLWDTTLDLSREGVAGYTVATAGLTSTGSTIPVVTVTLEDSIKGICQLTTLDPRTGRLASWQNDTDRGFPIMYHGTPDFDDNARRLTDGSFMPNGRIRILSAKGELLGTTKILEGFDPDAIQWEGNLLVYQQADSLILFDSAGTYVGSVPDYWPLQLNPSWRPLWSDHSSLWAIHDSTIELYSLDPWAHVKSLAVHGNIYDYSFVGESIVLALDSGRVVSIGASLDESPNEISMPNTAAPGRYVPWHIYPGRGAFLAITTVRDVAVLECDDDDNSLVPRLAHAFKEYIHPFAYGDSLWLVDSDGDATLLRISQSRLAEPIHIWDPPPRPEDRGIDAVDFIPAPGGVITIHRNEVARYRSSQRLPLWGMKYDSRVVSWGFASDRGLFCAITEDRNFVIINANSGRMMAFQRWPYPTCDISSIGSSRSVFLTPQVWSTAISTCRMGELNLDLRDEPLSRWDVSTSLGRSFLAAGQPGEATRVLMRCLDDEPIVSSEAYDLLLSSFLARAKFDSALWAANEFDKFIGPSGRTAGYFASLLKDSLGGAVLSDPKWSNRVASMSYYDDAQFIESRGQAVLAGSAILANLEEDQCLSLPDGIGMSPVVSDAYGPLVALVEDYNPSMAAFRRDFGLSVWDSRTCRQSWERTFEKPSVGRTFFRARVWVVDTSLIVVGIPTDEGIIDWGTSTTIPGFDAAVERSGSVADTVLGTAIDFLTLDAATGDTVSAFRIEGFLQVGEALRTSTRQGTWLMLEVKNLAVVRRHLVLWNDDSLQVYQLENGMRLVSVRFERPPTSMHAAGSQVVLREESGQLSCFDPSTGDFVWTDNNHAGRILGYGDTLVFYNGKTIEALVCGSHASGGPRQLWKTSVPDLHSGLPRVSVSGGHVTIGPTIYYDPPPYDIEVVALSTGKSEGTLRIAFELRDYFLSRREFCGIKPDGTVFRAPLEKLIHPN